MTNNAAGKPVLICDTQPVAVEGLRCLLDTCDTLRFAGSVGSLDAASELTRTMVPAAVVLDKALGTKAIMDWLQEAGLQEAELQRAGLQESGTAGTTAPVVWGVGITESEALRFLQAGARGILRRTAVPETMLECLLAVTSGSTWMEDGIFGAADNTLEPRRSRLTAREHQIAELVEQGLRNRDIGRTLGIQTGTVKIHLKHIFEKTGVHGRYSLALTGLREKGNLVMAHV
jgi:two-component system, NarL family, nitrate/nitrite response regulator NarL